MNEKIAAQNEDFMTKMRNLELAYETYAKNCGMTYVSLYILDTIAGAGDFCTQKSICEETHYPKQTVNLTVKSFMDDGYVVLKELPEDRRHKGITLTKKGKEFVKEKVGPLFEADEEGMKCLTSGERAELLRLLEKYEKAYCQKLLG